ncbi:hypothetical protein J1N35_029604 [Gossypium stocksii]|uniref:Uncharacterized protein n=1 Tax=Gossypium stocksii TaxID=47602 RepID=A0A9D3UZ62_9ROSI|nr:hypothetical protein J1N35_029604 [Gossypium stocksii]
MDEIPTKLGKLRDILKKEIGRISANKRKASTLSNTRLEELCSIDPDDEMLAEMEEVKLALNLESDKDELFLEQRARVNWIQFGDRNTYFFYNFANQRRKRNTVKKLKGPNREWIVREEEKAIVGTRYFKELFTTSNTWNTNRVLTGISM